MGQLLEKVVKKKGIKITVLATALGTTRTTLYNWFKKEVIDEVTMERISSVISYDISSPDRTTAPIIKAPVIEQPLEEEKDEEYWKNRYVDLLERDAKLLETKA